MTQDPAQCPECNLYEDRSDQVQLVDEDPYGSDEPRYACLNPSCAAYLFSKGSDRAFGLLNVDGIRDSGKTLMEVKREKLSNYDDVIDWSY